MEYFKCLAKDGHNAIVRYDSIEVVIERDGNIYFHTQHGEFCFDKKKDEDLDNCNIYDILIRLEQYKL